MQPDSCVIIAVIFTAQVVRWIVWSGLVAATVALLVLMRTHWGGSEPLRKCIVLSVFVHLMFGIYTTTVNIVAGNGDGSGGDEGPMYVAIDEGGLEDMQAEADAADSHEKKAPSSRSRLAKLDEPEDTPRLRNDLLGSKTIRELPDLVRSSIERVTKTVLDRGKEPPVAKVDPQVELPKENRAPQEVPPPEPDSNNTAATKTPEPSGPIDYPRDPQESPSPPRTKNETAVRSEKTTGSPQVADAKSATDAGDTMGALVPVVIGSSNAGGGNPSSGSASVPAALQGRVGSARLQRALANGGSRDTEAAVVAALKWLAAQQSADGRWNAAQLEAGREVRINGHDRSGAGAHADTGITGLALLALLAHGNTHLQGEHPKTVQRGLEWLLSMQASDGNLGGNAAIVERTYCHGIATCALSEAYAMSRDERLAAPVRLAISYCVRTQDRVGGGWRYRPGSEGDTSQLGWQVMALKSAELARIEIPSTTRAGIAKFLRSVASGNAGGLASYRPGHDVTRTMSAEALVCRQFLGLAGDNSAGSEAANYIVQELPGLHQENVYYWYYGTLGMFQMQGEGWRTWNKALQAALLNTQRVDGDYAGSWDPDNVWGAYGGRAYSTALSALCLEVYYRFLPLYVEAAGREKRLN
jgi:hypothetical protein